MTAPPPTGSESVVTRPEGILPALMSATAEHVPQLAGALADAFSHDPVYGWMVPARRRQARLSAMFTAELQQYGLPQGTVWTTAGCDGAVVALPPGAWKMPMSMTLTEALVWGRAFGRRLLLAARVQRAMEERHLREPHFYVRIVAVRTALQGQGLGSALMRPTLQSADSAGLPTYIEASTERSAALYQRLGFQHIDVLELPDGGPPVWLMRRPPAAAPPDLQVHRHGAEKATTGIEPV